MKEYNLRAFCYNKIYSQEEGSKLIGIVENESSNKVMSGVHVINTSKVIGVITNNEGVFELEVSQNDTLYFSYIGYKPHGCLTPPDWKGEDNNAYLKYWLI